MPKRRTSPLRMKECLIPLSDEDRIRTRFALQHGEPAEIMVQLECWIGGKWEQVRRYDTKHGFLHVHLMPWDKRRDKRRRLERGLSEALSMAIAELKEGWPRYRAACETAKVGEGR